MSTQAVASTVTPLPFQMPLSPRPVKFDAAFLDRRMREHREWQWRQEWNLTVGITREILLLDELGPA